MKTLDVFWDPLNPLVRVSPIIKVLRRYMQLNEITFEGHSHRTTPGGSFAFDFTAQNQVLWIEGGPFPNNLSECRSKKTAWLFNTFAEPTLLSNLADQFDLILSADRNSCDGRTIIWLSSSIDPEAPNISQGLHLLAETPLNPHSIKLLLACAQLANNFSEMAESFAVLPGEKGGVSPLLFDALSQGAVSFIDAKVDLRDVAIAGHHLYTFDSAEHLEEILRNLPAKSELLKTAQQGRDMALKFHSAEVRAERLALIMTHRTTFLSGAELSCDISVLVFCYKYAKRLRIYLESLARQFLGSSQLEIVVADPNSPDDLKQILHAFAASNPSIRLVHVELPERYATNRGLCINCAFQASSGSTIISTDGDIVFPKHLIRKLHELVMDNPKSIFGVRRMFLNADITQSILNKTLDPFINFESLCSNSGDGEPNSVEGVLGYCQACCKDAFGKAGYPEDFDMINQSDIVFLERLQSVCSVYPRFEASECVLHLWHPRNWKGTQDYL